MANVATNRGKYLLLGQRYRAATAPTTLNVALCTSAASPTADTNTLSELTQIATGNGYSDGGIAVTPGATDFDVYTEDDTNDYAYVQLKDIVWTASGGNLPASGNGARWAVLTTNEGTVGNRQIEVAWDLTSDRTVSVSQTLTLQNAEIRLT